jgi:undecaprenyl diphosphate synthase
MPDTRAQDDKGIPDELSKKLRGSVLPRHVAVIMDGNGRWAAQRGLPRSEGHSAGARAVRAVVEAAAEIGLGYLTLYSFSTENWRRPEAEIRFLMDLLRRYLRDEVPTLMENNVRLRAIGRLDDLSFPVRRMLRRVSRQTERNTGLVLTLALSYGGRAELVDAVKAAVDALQRGTLTVEEIDEALLGSLLQSSFLPDPDLIVRTSGEMRISNFLIWQAAYAEFYVTEVLWPDFGKRELVEALLEYSRRRRRFGAVEDVS